MENRGKEVVKAIAERIYSLSIIVISAIVAIAGIALLIFDPKGRIENR